MYSRTGVPARSIPDLLADVVPRSAREVAGRWLTALPRALRSRDETTENLEKAEEVRIVTGVYAMPS